MDSRLPKLPFKLLRLFCPAELLEEIEGDLVQRYERDLQRKQFSRWKLWWNTIRFFRPGIVMRNKFSVELTSFNMIANYFKVALRFMQRNVAFSIINISGLALGITGALLLFLWIAQEFSFDQYHHNKDRLYVGWNRATENGRLVCWQTTPRVLAPTLKEEYAAVEASASYAKWGVSHLFTVGDNKLMKTSGVFTDASLFNILTFQFHRGDAQKAFNEPNSIVVTESFARQLFGEKEAFGEIVTISQSGYQFEFVVSAVIGDLPPNTDFTFDYLLPFAFLESLGEKDTYWGNNSVTTLVKLQEGHDLNSVNESVKNIVKQHFAEGQHIEIFLYPLTKMRLYSRFENGVAAGGRIEIIRMLGILGIVLLAIACINFINLSTARAQRRAKEVAVRKVTGAFRTALISQFLCEALMMAFLAGLLSLAITYLLLPSFSLLIHQPLTFALADPIFWGVAIAGIIGVGIIAGSYPAFYVSAFKPVSILKGVSRASYKSVLRTLLVVFQFGFAVTMIASAIVIRKQITYVQNRDAGYSRENLIYVQLTGDLSKNFQAFKHEAIEQGLASAATQVSSPITEQWSSTGGIQWSGKDPNNRTDFERIYMDHQTSATFGLNFVHGRDFDLQQFHSDSTAAIVNETALKVMGLANPIGEIIQDDGHSFHIVGVVKDFVFTSPFQPVEPIVIFSGSKLGNAFNVAYFKLQTNRPTAESIQLLQALAAKHNPAYPFEYQFADLDYAKKFENIQVTLLLTTVFTSVAIFIACLGLLGLATHMMELRVKEIGIRKVMGGSVLSITQLLSFTTLKPILIAVIIFTPVAWLSMNWWLQSFAYRTSLDVSLFVGSAASLIIIAMLTIGLQTLRAARTNPAESLRNE